MYNNGKGGIIVDIKWKDLEGNILNANNDRLIYFESKKDVKTTIRKKEVKKITIEDGIMHIFKDYDNDLVLSIVIPKKKKKDANRIFNYYDKTGNMLKGNTGNFLVDLILESSLATGHPLTGVVTIFFLFAFALLVLVSLLDRVLGELGIVIARILIIGYPSYLILSRIRIRIIRKKLKENN